jgi:hypothetical protein
MPQVTSFVTVHPDPPVAHADAAQETILVREQSEVKLLDAKADGANVLFVLPPTSHATASQWQRDICERLWMHPTAADGWIQWHVSLGTAMLSFFVPEVLAMACLVYEQTGARLTHYIFSVPTICTIGFHGVHIIAAWRWGPQAFRSAAFLVTLPIFVISNALPHVVSFISEPRLAPFGNLIHFTAVTALYGLFHNMANKTGLRASERPAVPRCSIFVPVIQAVVTTVRVMDSFTDMSFIRVLIDHVRNNQNLTATHTHNTMMLTRPELLSCSLICDDRKKSCVTIGRRQVEGLVHCKCAIRVICCIIMFAMLSHGLMIDYANSTNLTSKACKLQVPHAV